MMKKMTSLFARHIKRKIVSGVSLGMCLGVLLAAPVRPAHALCIINGAEPWWQTANFSSLMQQYFNNTLYQNQFVNDFYNDHIVNELWRDNMLPALRQMAGQIISANVDTTGMIGGFMDGQSVLETQLRIQELHARAIKDYTPGETLCRFGTGVRSLAAAQDRATLNNNALSKMTQDRLLGSKGSSGAGGPAMDRQARLDTFRRIYCNPGDNNGHLGEICNVPTNPVSVPRRFNNDIDIARAIDSKQTLNLDFTDGTLTDDEQDVLALSQNLYGHEIFEHLHSVVFQDRQGDPNDQAYLDLRQIAALRSVAQNSYDTITSMRGRGATGSSDYLRHALMEMGMTDAEAQRYLAGSTSGGGSASEPSYFAQMEILTKKLYQNPNFYVNLIDKPANVKRQIAAMKGFELMQNRDIFESMQRQEMLMSLLLELEVRDEQESVQRDIEGMAKN